LVATFQLGVDQKADFVNFDDFLAWRAKMGNLLAVVWFEK
jgi:hypothetical protein